MRSADAARFPTVLRQFNRRKPTKSATLTEAVFFRLTPERRPYILPYITRTRMLAMLTIRQVERLWQLKAHERLIGELCSGRAEAVGGIRQLLRGPLPAAALTIIRMNELHQAHTPQVQRMLRYVL